MFGGKNAPAGGRFIRCLPFSYTRIFPERVTPPHLPPERDDGAIAPSIDGAFSSEAR